MIIASAHGIQDVRKQPQIARRRTQVAAGKGQMPMPKLPCRRTREQLMDAVYDYMLSGDAREISRVFEGRTGIGEAMIDRAGWAEALAWRAKARNLEQVIRNAGPLAESAMQEILSEMEGAA